MKLNLPVALLFTFLAVYRAKAGAIKSPLSIITLDDISQEERQHLEAMNEEYERSKRSGGQPPDVLSALKYLLAQGAKAKLRLLGKASAAASSHLASAVSSASSGGKSYGGYGGHSYGNSYHGFPEDDSDSNTSKSSETQTDTAIERIDRSTKGGKTDPWSMKKTVLNTLLQAVKAIKGGVLALKGQLIKGGGFLLVGGGQLVKAKGEVITNLGKKIAKTAFRSMGSDHSSETHEDGSYGHYHASSLEYGPPPSGPGPVHSDHFHHQGFHDSYSESKQPAYHAAEPGPNFGTIMGKFLSAASSLNPESPAPFTDYSYAHSQPQEHNGDGNNHSDDSDQKDQGNFDSDFQSHSAFDTPEANKIVQPEKSGETSIGYHNIKTSEHIPDDHPPPPQTPFVEQSLPSFPATNFQAGPLQDSQNSPGEFQFGPTLDITKDFMQLNQQSLPNDFHANYPINSLNLFNFANGGNFAEPPSSENQQHFDQNTQSITSNSNQFTHINSQPPNPQNGFNNNFAEPPPNYLRQDKESEGEESQDSQPPSDFGAFEPAPTYLDQNDLSTGANSYPNFGGSLKSNNKFPEIERSKPTPIFRPQQSNKSPEKNYNKYRGSVNHTPRVNAHMIDPSSNLDLPHFSPQSGNPSFRKGNNSPPAFLPYAKMPPYSPKSRPPSGPNFHPTYRQKPTSFGKTGHGPSQHFNRPSTRSKPPPNFDISQSISYQLGPNGPKLI